MGRPVALMGEAIARVEEGRRFPLQWWCLRDCWSFKKRSPIIKVVREKKSNFMVNYVKYVICSFNRVQTPITFT